VAPQVVQRRSLCAQRSWRRPEPAVACMPAAVPLLAARAVFRHVTLP
jgi:hypothetical protein